MCFFASNVYDTQQKLMKFINKKHLFLDIPFCTDNKMGMVGRTIYSLFLENSITRNE